MKGSSGLALAVVIVFILGCATNTPRPAARNDPLPATAIQPVINIPELAGKGAAFVDARLGRPTEVTPTDDPGTTPGEFRDYKVAGVTPNLTAHGLMVRFYRDQAIHFTFDLPRAVDTQEEALALAGIDVEGAAPRVIAPVAKRWSGTFNGVRFKDVAVLNLDAGSPKYTMVQAEVLK